jgi:hypothetical protein
VFDYYDSIEVNKKVLFQKFWQDADYDKTEEQLTTEFDAYFKANNKVVKPVEKVDVVNT